MSPKRTIAALAAAAALMWGSAHAAPEAFDTPVAPEATQDIPVIILELQPGALGGGGSEQEQAIMSMLLLQLLMGLQVEAEPSEVQPISSPTLGQSI